VSRVKEPGIAPESLFEFRELKGSQNMGKTNFISFTTTRWTTEESKIGEKWLSFASLLYSQFSQPG
jgi:hypothetical protein